jgi:uncharacterized protein
VFVATGRGAEGFLPDARVGRIRDAMTPDLAREGYGAGLAAGVDLIAQAFADEFGFALTGVEARPPPVPGGGSNEFPIPSIWLIAIVILLIIVTRGRILLLLFRFGGRGGGSWGGGGGFGGFGGGGGFSGGGAGGRF